jgi:DNA ligase 1
VVVGGLAGRGRRAGMYGALLLAVYDPAGERFQTICKCGTGFSDAELAGLPARLAPLARAQRPARVDSLWAADVWFEPTLVVEVLAAELTLSPHHTAGWGLLKEDAGLALRFPRFSGRWRDDKAPTDATTVSEVVQMFRTARRAPAGA